MCYDMGKKEEFMQITINDENFGYEAIELNNPG